MESNLTPAFMSNSDKNAFDIAFNNHAIGFANWLLDNCEMSHGYIYTGGKHYFAMSTEELYKLYLERL